MKPGVHVLLGGVPGTQCLDIGTAVRCVIEKRLDQRSRGAIAQADPEKYCDNLKIILISRYLVSIGRESGLAISCVRCQLLPRVKLSVCGRVHSVGFRAKGALTGSRVAGALDHSPVCYSMNNSKGTMQSFAFKLDDGKFLACASLIDNLVAFSNSVCCQDLSRS